MMNLQKDQHVIVKVLMNPLTPNLHYTLEDYPKKVVCVYLTTVKYVFPAVEGIPDGLTTDTKFLGCLELAELQSHHCEHVQLEECRSS